MSNIERWVAHDVNGPVLIESAKVADAYRAHGCKVEGPLVPAEQLRGAVDLLKMAVGCEHPDTCGGPTGQPICEPCIAFARAHVWGR